MVHTRHTGSLFSFLSLRLTLTNSNFFEQKRKEKACTKIAKTASSVFNRNSWSIQNFTYPNENTPQFVEECEREIELAAGTTPTSQIQQTCFLLKVKSLRSLHI